MRGGWRQRSHNQQQAEEEDNQEDEDKDNKDKEEEKMVALTQADLAQVSPGSGKTSRGSFQGCVVQAGGLIRKLTRNCSQSSEMAKAAKII